MSYVLESTRVGSFTSRRSRSGQCLKRLGVFLLVSCLHLKICGSNILFSGEYSEYTLVEDIPGFMNDYGMGLAFATTEVTMTFLFL